MCAEYQLTASKKEIKEAMGVPLTDDEISPPKIERRIKLSLSAPVIELRKDGPALTEKIFPVQPFPNSRLSGLAHGSEEEVPADREIERIYDEKTWKDGFEQRPLLIPMTGFLEPVYWGEAKGSVQEFKIPGETVFLAAGIAIKSRIPKTDSINAFTILTHTATKQMLSYHQRLVVLLKPEVAILYLEEMPARERFDFLMKNRYTGPLDLSHERVMAKGWEKRIAIQEAKLAREKAYLDSLKQEGSSG